MAIRVRAWPLELVNGTPLDPAATQEHAEDLREQVAPELFGHLDVDRFPTSTLEALALANRAYRTGLQVGERVSFALRDALFEEGRDISDPVTLEYLAHDLGVAPPDGSDRAAVLADWDEGRRRGVLGSPHFFCGDSAVFCPITRHHQGSRRRSGGRPGRLTADGVHGAVHGPTRPPVTADRGAPLIPLGVYSTVEPAQRMEV